MYPNKEMLDKANSLTERYYRMVDMLESMPTITFQQINIITTTELVDNISLINFISDVEKTNNDRMRDIIKNAITDIRGLKDTPNPADIYRWHVAEIAALKARLNTFVYIRTLLQSRLWNCGPNMVEQLESSLDTTIRYLEARIQNIEVLLNLFKEYFSFMKKFKNNPAEALSSIQENPDTDSTIELAIASALNDGLGDFLKDLNEFLDGNMKETED